MPLVDALGVLDAGLLARDTNPYVLLQQDFAERFARQLPDDAFHLQIKERSQNLERVQA
jgi:hypothetical protein